MLFAHKSKWIQISCSLALLTIVGCKGGDKDPGGQTAQMDKKAHAMKRSDEPAVTFPQTTEMLVADSAHPPKSDATVKRTYDDSSFGMTEVRSDEYVRHADPMSPTGWTPWHYRTAKHNWVSPPLTYESSVNGTWTAKVQNIDVPSRKITLLGPSDRSQEYMVDPKVERLNEIKVGDTVTLTWLATLQGELRAPTAQETADPVRVYNLVDRASSDEAPMGVMVTAYRVVTTVDAIDMPGMMVTLKGPLGNRIDVKAKSADNLKKLKVGDTIVVTYSQATVTAVTK